jgi:hypothetical protein
LRFQSRRNTKKDCCSQGCRSNPYFENHAQEPPREASKQRESKPVKLEKGKMGMGGARASLTRLHGVR